MASAAPARPGHGPGGSGAAAGAPPPGSARLSRDWVSLGLANGFPRAPTTGVFVESKRFVKFALTFTECELFLPASSLGCGRVPGQHAVFGSVCMRLNARETTRFGGRSVGLEGEGPRARASPACGGAGSSADPSPPIAERSPTQTPGFPGGRAVMLPVPWRPVRLLFRLRISA